MLIQKAKSGGDGQELHVDFTDPNMDLDVTSDKWLLAPATFPTIKGRDVIHAGRIAPDGGRRPVGMSCPKTGEWLAGMGDVNDAGFVLLDADESVLNGWTTKRYADVYGLKVASYEDNPYSGTTTTLRKLLSPFAWPQEMIGATIIRNDDGRAGTRETALITAISTDVETDDTLEFFPAMSAWSSDDKFSISYRVKEDQRGIWIFSGRYVYLLQGGTLKLMLIVPGENARGERWNIAKISSSLVMLTNAKNVPHVVSLSDSEFSAEQATILYQNSGDIADNEVTVTGESWTIDQYVNHVVKIAGAYYTVLSNTADTLVLEDQPGDGNDIPFEILDLGARYFAGMLTPIKPLSVERSDCDQADYANPSWKMIAVPASGALSAGAYRVKLRAVNLLHGGESKFVDVMDYDTATDKWTYYLTASANDAISVYEMGNVSGFIDLAHVFECQPANAPLHERWTHLEVWRTEADKEDFFLERRIEIVRLSQEDYVDAIDNRIVSSSTDQIACVLSDASLKGLTPMSDTDAIAGYPPPACKQAISISGVTVCAGSTDASFQDPTVCARGLYFSEGSYSTVTKYLNKVGFFATYTFRDGDELVIEAPDEILVGPGVYCYPIGVYPIASGIDDDNIELARGPDAIVSHLIGYIRRPHIIDWPRIESDEDLWYSRTDKSAPESFLSRTLRLSDIGDTFQRMVSVLNYAAVVMLRGVHLVFLSGTELVKDTISQDGHGTPWPDSVVSLDRHVVWATPRGPMSMTVSEEASYEGHRGVIAPLDTDGRMRQWFEDAYDNQWPIDAGVDTHNATIRFRRRVDDNTFEVLQYSYRTKKWTMLDDDAGVRYARSCRVEATDRDDAICYSVTPEWNLFEINHYAQADAYSGATVQDVINDDRFTVNGNVAASVFTVSGASPGWATDEWLNYVAVIDAASYRITANGANTLTLDDGGLLAGDKTALVLKYDVSTTQLARTGVFSTKMLGDVLRVRSSASARNGACRVIRTATADLITFDAIAGLTHDDEFIIGANRFLLETEPYVGVDRESVKTLEAVTVKVATGPRHRSGGIWETEDPGRISVRAVINHEDEPSSADEAPDGGVVIADPTDTGTISRDHVSSIDGIGHSVALQVECIEARTDFRIEMLKMQVSDSGQKLEDASTAE